MKKLLKVAVIGVGNMGKHHARVYSEMTRVQLVGVSDLNTELGSQVASEFNTQFYAQYHDMIQQEQPDIVSICTPTATHFAIATDCIQKNVHVLLEKPITPDLKTAEELLKFAKKKNVQLLVGHIERHNPAVKKVKDMIQKGDLGQVTTIIARRVGGFPPQIKDVNIVVDLAIHDIDIINYFLDELPQKHIIHKEKQHLSTREDAAELFLIYKKSSAYIQANWITPVKIRKLHITGTEGYLEMDYITQKITFFKSNYNKFKEQIGGFSDYILRFSEPDKIDISVAKKEPLREELEYFIDAVENNKHIDSQFAIDALRIALS